MKNKQDLPADSNSCNLVMCYMIVIEDFNALHAHKYGQIFTLTSG